MILFETNDVNERSDYIDNYYCEKFHRKPRFVAFYR